MSAAPTTRQRPLVHRQDGSRIARLAADHADFPYLRASATTARALVRADAELAAEAVIGHDDDPRPLVRAAALEDAGRLQPPLARHQAITYPTEALGLYTAAGADLDVARVRALLRSRGLRRATANRSSPGLGRS